MESFVAIDFETANQYRNSMCSVGIVAHNSPFDEGCLKAVYALYDMSYPGYQFYCTCRAARRAFPDLVNHQLHTVSSHLGFELKDHHNALADAEACAQIAINIL